MQGLLSLTTLASELVCLTASLSAIIDREMLLALRVLSMHAIKKFLQRRIMGCTESVAPYRGTQWATGVAQSTGMGAEHWIATVRLQAGVWARHLPVGCMSAVDNAHKASRTHLVRFCQQLQGYKQQHGQEGKHKCHTSSVSVESVNIKTVWHVPSVVLG